MIACTALRTNLTIRELGGLPGRASTSDPGQPHSKVGAPPWSRRRSRSAMVMDRGRDPRAYPRPQGRAQVLVRRRDLRVFDVSGRAWQSQRPERLSRFPDRGARQHRRVLAGGGYRGVDELLTPVFQRNRILRDESWQRHRLSVPGLLCRVTTSFSVAGAGMEGCWRTQRALQLVVVVSKKRTAGNRDEIHCRGSSVRARWQGHGGIAGLWVLGPARELPDRVEQLIEIAWL